MLEGQLDRKGGAIASITGFWWSLDANEISGTWSASRLDSTVLEKLIEPKLTGEPPLVTKCSPGCRLTAQGLKNKGKPMCSSKHMLSSKKNADDYEEEMECERCGREVNGPHWHCPRCEVCVCSRCEKQTVAKDIDEDERRQAEVAALDRFKLAGKVYFELSVEKVGEGGLLGLALQNADDDYAPGEDMGTFALMHSGICRHNGKDDGKSAAWKDGVVLCVAVDCDAGTVQIATLDKPAFETVLQLADEEKPAEVGLPLVALLSPGDKGAMTVNVGQQPFKLQPPAKEYKPIAELMELRKQWRVTLPDNVETWPVYVKPSRQAEGAESLQAQWGFEELALAEENGVKWVRHNGGWSPVSLEALGRLCTGLTPLPSTIDALEKRGDANGFKFFRLVVTKVRGGDTVNGVALGQLLLRKEGVELDLAEATAENPDGQCADGEGPQNAIDGRTSTRWHTSVLSPLVIKLPKPALIDSFSFRTAPSEEQLDPVEWRLEASNDQSTWKVLHGQETSYHPPKRRCGQASWFETSNRNTGTGKSKLVPWTSGAKVQAGAWHALTLSVDLPNSKVTVWLDGEVALEICDPSSPLLRCDGPLSLDPAEGLCLFGRKPFLKKEWSWMLGAQIKNLQLQTLVPSLFNVWALQMPLGVWICREGSCKTTGLFTRNAASSSQCWRCKCGRIRSAFRPPNDTDPRHPGIKIITTDSLEEILEKDKCVFIALSADWCGACQQMKPAWFALAKLLQTSSAVTVAVMNIDENDVDRRYFPERHIPVVKLLVKKVSEDGMDEKPTVLPYEGGHSIASWLSFLMQHTSLNLQEVLDSNYDSYVKEFNIESLLKALTAAARTALKEGWGADSAVGGGNAGGWRRLCAFLCNYCWDPDQYSQLPAAPETGEDELWIRLLLKRVNEEAEKALRGGHPRQPLAFLLEQVFLPGSKPDDLQTIRAGMLAENVVQRGDSGESKDRAAAQQWSAVEQQKAAARAEPMARPMLQRSWAKIKQAIDSRSPKRMQTLQELLTRGLDLDFEDLGHEQPSVMWLAAANNDLEVLQFCLAYGANPHRATEGVLPTEAAAATGSLQALAMLLRVGAVCGRALHFAAATSQLGALKVLVNAKADVCLRVRGLSPLAVAASRDNDEVVRFLLANWQQEPLLGSEACEALGLNPGSNVLYLAAHCGLDRICDLMLQRGVKPNTEVPKTVGNQLVQEHVRAVLEPHRWMLLRRMCPEDKPEATAAAVFKQASEEFAGDRPEDLVKRGAVFAGVGPLRPATMASLLDDPEAVKQLAEVDTSGDPLPGPMPSALMWAQWAQAQQASRVMLDAGVTLSNADLEGLRRLGRARRSCEATLAAGKLLENKDWKLLPKAIQPLASATPMSRLQELREKMLLGIRDVSQVAVDEVAPPVLLQMPSQPPQLNRVTSTQVEQEEASAKEEVAASTLLDMLGPVRTSLMRFLVQREIARGEGKSGLSPNYLLALHATTTFVDIHAECQRFLVLLKAALGTLPSARGPCYRAVSRENKAVALKQYSPGSIIRWPAGACGTLDFGAAMSALSLAGDGPGVIFKVRRLLSAKEVDESNRQVLFMGGAMRVVGLFPLSGPLLAAERELAQKPASERLGSWCPSLDMVRRPETAQPAEMETQPLVMVLLDEEEEN
ncbi:unnamed protein product [Effrenium voratum]|nr:unnamed protein product [Effrenium voratum]